MASFHRRGSTWRALVCVNRIRDSRTFATKKEAQAWAGRREHELLQASAAGSDASPHTLAQALTRYAKEISPTHKGQDWELVRLRSFSKQAHFPRDKWLHEITVIDLIAWRDARLSSVSPSSVLREISLLSSVFEAARRQWLWITENPVHSLVKPRAPASRDKLLTKTEIKAVLRSLKYEPSAKRPQTVTQTVAIAFLLALRTGMRAGELCGLTWDRVEPSHARLPITKNGTARDVPISKKAARVLSKMTGWDDESVLAIDPRTLDALFRKAKKSAGIENVVFHDTRHWAATHMAQKLPVLDLCRAFGWKNPKMAMVYYNRSAADIAQLLN